MEIQDSNIAVIEQLHDLLLEKGVPLSAPVLVKSRELTSNMQDEIDERENPFNQDAKKTELTESLLLEDEYEKCKEVANKINAEYEHELNAKHPRQRLRLGDIMGKYCVELSEEQVKCVIDCLENEHEFSIRTKPTGSF